MVLYQKNGYRSEYQIMWFNKINHSQFIFVGVETIPKWVVYCFNHIIGIIITIPLFHNHILIIIQFFTSITMDGLWHCF